MLTVAALLEVIGIGLVPVVVAAIANSDRILAHPLAGEWLLAWGMDSRRELLVLFATLLLAVFALKTAYKLFTSWMQARLLQNLRVRLSTRMFDAYMHAPYTFHLGRNAAELMRNANQEVERLVEQVVAPILTLLAYGIIGAGIIAFMLVVQPWVTLLGLGFFGAASYAFLALLRFQAMAHGRVAQHHRGGLIKAVNQGLGGFKEARVLGRERAFVEAYRLSARRLAAALKHRFVTSQMIAPGLEFVAVVGLTAVAALLLLTGVAAQDVVPVLALFAAALLRLKQVMSQLVGTVNVLRYEHVTVIPIYEDLQALDESLAPCPDERPGQRLSLRHAIELENVSYQYPGGQQPALNNVTLKIPWGASIAFVGTTGAGKSTLADVLLGLLRPQSGTVRVDGVDIHDDVRAWQASIGYIPQSLYIIDDTLRRNIAFGLADEAIDENRVREAARMAQLNEVIAQLSDGYDTLLGDRGARLSGGQRQRVCIARALYHDPDVLILDEATSALDNLTERRIVEELEAGRGDRTLIVIAHRLTTVQRCDSLYLLHRGRIDASGTFEDLFDTNKQFQALASTSA